MVKQKNNIEKFIEILSETDIRFQLRSEVGGYRLSKTDESGKTQAYLIFKWKDDETNRTLDTEKLIKSLPKNIGNSICLKGNGALYTPHGKYGVPWSYSLLALIFLEDDEVLIKELIEIINFCSSSNEISILDFIDTLSDYWKTDVENKISYWI